MHIDLSLKWKWILKTMRNLRKPAHRERPKYLFHHWVMTYNLKLYDAYIFANGVDQNIKRYVDFEKDLEIKIWNIVWNTKMEFEGVIRVHVERWLNLLLTCMDYCLTTWNKPAIASMWIPIIEIYLEHGRQLGS